MNTVQNSVRSRQSFEEKKWPSANDNFQLSFQNPLTEANNMIVTYIITEEKKKGKDQELTVTRFLWSMAW